jgi:SPFH domain / Band 7 family
MKGRFNPIAILMLIASFGIALGIAVLGHPGIGGLAALLGAYASLSPRMLQEWERGVLLRLGRFTRILEPGISWTFPAFDRLNSTVDMRIRSTSFAAEKTLTKDTVPVNVDAILFWVVTDAKRAIVEVEDYESTVSWAAQTTLRDVIGQTELVRMIADRETIDTQLQQIIDAKTTDWGVTVQSVEIRDVRIPSGLEDAMSRKAEREREARILLAESEVRPFVHLAGARGEPTAPPVLRPARRRIVGGLGPRGPVALRSVVGAQRGSLRLASRHPVIEALQPRRVRGCPCFHLVRLGSGPRDLGRHGIGGGAGACVASHPRSSPELEESAENAPAGPRANPKPRRAGGSIRSGKAGAAVPFAAAATVSPSDPPAKAREPRALGASW